MGYDDMLAKSGVRKMVEENFEKMVEKKKGKKDKEKKNGGKEAGTKRRTEYIDNFKFLPLKDDDEFIKWK